MGFGKFSLVSLSDRFIAHEIKLQTPKAISSRLPACLLKWEALLGFPSYDSLPITL